MRILVAVASRHGATHEIAERIGAELARCGFDVRVAAIEDVTDVDGYEAFVVGSAVYVGHWLEPARAFVERHGVVLAARPTWLFSSGPTGEPPRPDAGDAVDVRHQMQATVAREHRLFAGKLDAKVLGFGERALVFAVRATQGDFRDWDEIDAWAASVAAALRSPS